MAYDFFFYIIYEYLGNTKKELRLLNTIKILKA